MSVAWRMTAVAPATSSLRRQQSPCSEVAVERADLLRELPEAPDRDLEGTASVVGQTIGIGAGLRSQLRKVVDAGIGDHPQFGKIGPERLRGHPVLADQERAGPM
ncbi:MAG: hypothetical protein AAFX62_11585, partial [Pseudomonadota bacterium]